MYIPLIPINTFSGPSKSRLNFCLDSFDYRCLVKYKYLGQLFAVNPLLSGSPLSAHPLLKGHVSNSQKSVLLVTAPIYCKFDLCYSQRASRMNDPRTKIAFFTSAFLSLIG